MAYTGAEYSLGFVEGFQRRRREQRVEKTAAEDRERRIEREEAADTFTQETRDRQRKTWAAEDAEAPVRAEQRQLELANLRAKAEREGGLDFLYDLDAGDVNAAVNRYNARGTSKIDPRSVRIRGRKVQFTHSDTDGDGKPDTVSGDLDQMISAAERKLGKKSDRKLHNVPQGSVAIDTETNEPIYTNPKAASPQRPIVVGPNSTLLDPTTRKPIPVPRPKKSGGAAAGGRGLSKFNPERYNADVQGELARLVGGSYDQANLRFDYGQASKKMPPFTRVALDEAARLNRTLQGEIPAQLIAAIVAEEVNAFDETAIRERARTRALQNGDVKPEGFGSAFGLGKPNPAALKTIEDESVNQELQNTIGRIRTVIAYEEQKALAGRAAAEAAAEDETAQAEATQADVADAGDETATGNPDDYAPAIKWPAEAPPRNLFGKARPGTRLKANGQLWIIKPDGTPQRVQ